MPLKTINNEDNKITCVFCRFSTVDEINLGPIYAVDDVACHYYCMLFSAALSQNGRDEEGILGFLSADIWKEVRRSNRLRCSHCHGIGASVGCCKKACKQAFHFTCGLKSGVQFQFHGNYEAFCIGHSKSQLIPAEFKDWNCPICISRVTDSDEPVMANCCKGAVFHKECLKKMALNAGYFFKCPMCNATKTFIQEMRTLGIFVPEQDASWERDPNAFEDLLFQYSKCDAEVCMCSKGREYNASKGGFILARCRICGAAGVHRECGKLKTVANWACSPCKLIETKTDEERVKTETGILVPAVSSTSGSTNALFRHRRIVNPPPVSSPRLRECDRWSRVHQMKDEVVDISKVRISPSCFPYFPYFKNMMTVFQSGSRPVVPDWRGLTLRVNVVDWLGHYMRRIVGINIPQPAGMIQTPSTVNRVSVQSFHQQQSTEKLTKLTKSKTIRKKNYRKRSRWGRGVISRSRRKGLISKSETSGTDDKSLKSSSQGLSSSQPSSSRALSQLTVEVNNSQQKEAENVDSQSPYETLLKSSVVKKRRVIELGHQIIAQGETKEFYVQSNVEIDDVELNRHEDLDIDLDSLQPLKMDIEYERESETVFLEKNSMSGINDSMQEVPTNQQDCCFGIWSEHSYFKTTKLLAHHQICKKKLDPDFDQSTQFSKNYNCSPSGEESEIRDDKVDFELIVDKFSKKTNFNIELHDDMKTQKQHNGNHETLCMEMESQLMTLPKCLELPSTDFTV